MILLTKKGQQIIIDDCYFEILSKYIWHINAQGYPMTSIYEGRGYQKMVKLHHVIMGQPLNGLVTDHINRNKLDNRKENLRICTQSVNLLNHDLQESRNSFGVGVDMSGTKLKPYRAKIYIRGKKVHLGCYKSPQEARHAYDEAKNKAQIPLLTRISKM